MNVTIKPEVYARLKSQGCDDWIEHNIHRLVDQWADLVTHPRYDVRGFVWSEEDWATRRAVMHVMRPLADAPQRLSDFQWRQVYLVGADGFGKIDEKFAQDSCWDWSHCRDSTIRGVQHMALMIRHYLGCLPEPPAEK